MLKVSCDLDDTLIEFWNIYLDRFGTPKSDSEVTRNVVRKLKNDKEFWINLPLKNKINFIPKQFTTSRIIPKSWIKESLNRLGFPDAPVYQVLGYGISKAHHVKAGGCDVHIDDSLRVFKDLNSKGIPCLLLDTPYNQEWGPVGRIFNLDREEIEDCYHLFLKTLFPYFNELCD